MHDDCFVPRTWDASVAFYSDGKEMRPLSLTVRNNIGVSPALGAV